MKKQRFQVWWLPGASEWMPDWLWNHTVYPWIKFRRYTVKGVMGIDVGLPDDDDVLDVTLSQPGRWGREVRLRLDPESLRFLASSLDELVEERDKFDAEVAEGVRSLDDL